MQWQFGRIGRLPAPAQINKECPKNESLILIDKYNSIIPLVVKKYYVCKISFLDRFISIWYKFNHILLLTGHPLWSKLNLSWMWQSWFSNLWRFIRKRFWQRSAMKTILRLYFLWFIYLAYHQCHCHYHYHHNSGPLPFSRPCWSWVRTWLQECSMDSEKSYQLSL